MGKVDSRWGLLQAWKTAHIPSFITSALSPYEYADLDSIASAVAFAYLQSQVAPDRESTAYLPLVNIPRADLKLRTDCLWLLTDSGVDIDALAFADEVRVEGCPLYCMYHVSCIMYRVSCIVYHVSCIVYRVSCIMYRVSCIVYCISCIVYHVSCIMYHVSCIMYHVSCIMYHVWTIQ